MFGIKEILDKAISKRPLTEEEKFKLLHSKRIEYKVVKYLMIRLCNLYIEVLGQHKGTLFELMPKGKLEGWCWQTTESAIVFLNDDDYIERGYLYFNESKPYYHSWICFHYNGSEYVLDPCLNFLCKKKDYTKIFETVVKGKVSAKAVKEELIKQVTTPKQEDNSDAHKCYENFLSSFFGEAYEKYKEEKKNEVIVDGPEDVNTPLYRNGAGYKIELENKKIKRLVVHYYYNDF